MPTLKQDPDFESVEERVRKVVARVDELERRAGLRDAVLEAHGVRLKEIDPLVGLVEFVESIKRFFANMRI